MSGCAPCGGGSPPTSPPPSPPPALPPSGSPPSPPPPVTCDPCSRGDFAPFIANFELPTAVGAYTLMTGQIVVISPSFETVLPDGTVCSESAGLATRACHAAADLITVPELRYGALNRLGGTPVLNVSLDNIRGGTLTAEKLRCWTPGGVFDCLTTRHMFPAGWLALSCPPPPGSPPPPPGTPANPRVIDHLLDCANPAITADNIRCLIGPRTLTPEILSHLIGCLPPPAPGEPPLPEPTRPFTSANIRCAFPPGVLGDTDLLTYLFGCPRAPGQEPITRELADCLFRDGSISVTKIDQTELVTIINQTVRPVGTIVLHCRPTPRLGRAASLAAAMAHPGDAPYVPTPGVSIPKGSVPALYLPWVDWPHAAAAKADFDQVSGPPAGELIFDLDGVFVTWPQVVMDIARSTVRCSGPTDITATAGQEAIVFAAAAGKVDAVAAPLIVRAANPGQFEGRIITEGSGAVSLFGTITMIGADIVSRTSMRVQGTITIDGGRAGLWAFQGGQITITATPAGTVIIVRNTIDGALRVGAGAIITIDGAFGATATISPEPAANGNTITVEVAGLLDLRFAGASQLNPATTGAVYVEGGVAVGIGATLAAAAVKPLDGRAYA